MKPCSSVDSECPAVYLHGDHAYIIGEDVTDTTTLPEGYGVGPTERLIRIPRTLLVEAAQQLDTVIPDGGIPFFPIEVKIRENGRGNIFCPTTPGGALTAGTEGRIIKATGAEVKFRVTHVLNTDSFDIEILTHV